MSMFETVGRSASQKGRKQNTLRKLERLNRTLAHQEPDRVPISDFFWGSFTRRWREELGLPDDADPYDHYDLDFIVTVPNMDPWIRPFETLEETVDEVVVKTGYGAVMHKRFEFPMPEMRAWEVDTIEKLERAEFDDPRDRRRFFEAGDNQIAGVGDGFERNSPPWVETVSSLRPDIPVYGSMGEVSECLTRLVGQHNALLWMGLYPERMGAAINRIGAHYLECARAAIDAARGTLDGFVIWGDVAYKKSMFFSPSYWREYFKPWVERMAAYAHDSGLPVIYHGCGNVKLIFQDFIDIGIDGYNPLEAKAGLDATRLRAEYGDGIALCGNSDVRIWETNDRGKVRREVLRMLRVAQGGGYVFMSDHSVTSGVSGHTYDYIVGLVKEHGRYPLDLTRLESDQATA